MLIYKFLNEEYGLEALRSRRLKISRISELNDPFELLAPNLSNPDMRNAFHTMKANLSKDKGMLCFSKARTNPLLWSHYADRHQGVCLGFHVPKEDLHKVIYTSTRPDPAKLFSQNMSVRVSATQDYLGTKYKHWVYENEMRLWVDLKDKDCATGHYFFDFSDSLKLTSVIVGAESKISRKIISASVKKHHPHVEYFKVRAAFNSFRVVRNQDASLWK